MDTLALVLALAVTPPALWVTLGLAGLVVLAVAGSIVRN